MSKTVKSRMLVLGTSVSLFVVYFLWGNLIWDTLKYNSLELAKTLDLAESNRPELIKVLDDYKGVDHRKFEAAKYLISNIDIHFSYRYVGADSTTNLDVKYDNILERDIKNIKSKYLIEHIEWAFKAWTESPWYNEISFDLFKEHILPYRSQNEPIVFWFEEMRNKYYDLIDSLPQISLKEACTVLNMKLEQELEYDTKWLSTFGIARRP